MRILTECAVSDQSDPRISDTAQSPRLVRSVAFDAYRIGRRRHDVHVARQRWVRAAEHCTAAASAAVVSRLIRLLHRLSVLSVK